MQDGWLADLIPSPATPPENTRHSEIPRKQELPLVCPVSSPSRIPSPTLAAVAQAALLSGPFEEMGPASRLFSRGSIIMSIPEKEDSLMRRGRSC